MRAKHERLRCAYCKRVLAWRDFACGVATVKRESWWVGWIDVPQHTADCEGVPVRTLRAAAVRIAEGT